MKILFITHRFQPEIGGVEKHTFKVAQELVKSGIEISVVTSTMAKYLAQVESQNRIQIHRLVLTDKFNPRLNLLLNLTKKWFFLLKNFKLIIDSDIIHLHDYPAFLWISPFIPFLRKHVFMTFHGFESYPVPKNARTIRRIAEKTVNGNICVGNFIQKWYGTHPNFITLGGVDIPTQTSNHINYEAVFIGRLASDTGILDLIEALRILKREFAIEIALHICGDGPFHKKIENDIKGCGLRIFIHGFVTDPENYLHGCRYAFVSGYLSILEAMSCRKPVFAFYSNPLKKDYLYSFPDAENLMIIANSPRDLAEKIYAAIKNPRQAELQIGRAYEFARKQTWNKIAAIYLKLYQEHGDYHKSILNFYT